MAGIRVNSGNVKVEVNDNGDMIILRKDINFVNKVYDFINCLDSVKDEYDRKIENIDKNEPDYQDKVLDCVYCLHKDLHDGIDFLFGKDTCKKVFGEGIEDVIPTIDGVVDFFDQITPYLSKLAKSISLSSNNIPANNTNSVNSVNSVNSTNSTNSTNVTPINKVGYMGRAHSKNYEGVFSNLRQQLDSNGDGNNEV